MAKSRKTRRAEAEKSLREAVRSHTKDGTVRIYPANAGGELPGVPAVAQDVTPDEAERLLAFRPAAFTLFESGNPMKEHALLDELDSEQAWGVSDPEDAPDETPLQSFPTTPVTEPAAAEQKKE